MAAIIVRGWDGSEYTVREAISADQIRAMTRDEALMLVDEVWAQVAGSEERWSDPVHRALRFHDDRLMDAVERSLEIN